MKKGFTLIEMLVVVGIIAVLVGASIAGFSKMTKTANRAKDQQAVSDAMTALAAIYENDGVWPKTLRTQGATDGLLDETTAIVIAKRKYIAMSVYDGKLSGADRFGLLTPWGQKVMTRKGAEASKTTPVTANSTIQDHILHFAIDLDGDGIIRGANVGGDTVDIRATAAVWSCGKDGVLEPYRKGLKKDDVYSWTVGQTKGIE